MEFTKPIFNMYFDQRQLQLITTTRSGLLSEQGQSDTDLQQINPPTQNHEIHALSRSPIIRALELGADIRRSGSEQIRSLRSVHPINTCASHHVDINYGRYAGDRTPDGGPF